MVGSPVPRTMLVTMTGAEAEEERVAPERDDVVAEVRRGAGQRHRADDGADDGAGEPDRERLPGAVGQRVAAHDERASRPPRETEVETISERDHGGDDDATP